MSAAPNPAYSHNGRAISAQAFYAIACDPQRNVMVQACAGAGKTWMLVSRMVRALLMGVKPAEILAITFTKKAAGEMRQRLQLWLREFAEMSAEQREQELINRGLSAPQAQQHAPRLAQLYRELLQNDQGMAVLTFHGWFATLLRQAPLELLDRLGLPAQYQLQEQDQVPLQQLWPRFYAAVAREPQALADFNALVLQHGRSGAHQALRAAWAQRVEFGLADARAAVATSVPPVQQSFVDLNIAEQEEFFWQPNESQHLLLQAAASALAAAKAPSFAALGQRMARALSPLDAPTLESALLTQSGSARKFGDKLQGIAQVRAAQEYILRVAQARRHHQAWQHQQRLMRLTRMLVSEYGALKRERGWIDMNDLERVALALLSDPVASGWVQERLDAQVRQLLIDEFQDTNPLQWQALRAWLSAYAGAGSHAPAVFMVGDANQSIYRFRRADPQLLLEAQDFLVQGLQGDVLSCDHTQRNATAVLHLVNQVMQEAQRRGELPQYRLHTSAQTQAGQVLHLPLVAAAAKPKTSALWRNSLTQARELASADNAHYKECQQVGAWIAARLAAGQEPASIMVLARRRERLVQMEQVLRGLGIAVQQPEAFDLAQAAEVQDLAAVLQLLSTPGQDLALARVLKSPLFGLDDQALIKLALAQRAQPLPQDDWLDLLLSQPWQHLPVLQQAAKRLQRWLDWAQQHSAFYLLHAIYRDADVLARYAAALPPAAREMGLMRLRAFLSLVTQPDQAATLTISTVLEQLRAGAYLMPAQALDGAVQLLTIHGAKGLEADTVILLDSAAAPPKARSMAVLCDWPSKADAPARLLFCTQLQHTPAVLTPWLEVEQKAAEREELNTLYVAMTRARNTLVFSASASQQPHDSSVWQRIQGLSEVAVIPLIGDSPRDAPHLIADKPTAVVMLREAPERAQNDEPVPRH